MVPALGDLGRGKSEAGPDLFLTQGVRLAQVLRSLASGQGPEDHADWQAGAPNDRLPAPHGGIDRDVVLPGHAVHPQPLYVFRRWRSAWRGGCGSNPWPRTVGRRTHLCRSSARTRHVRRSPGCPPCSSANLRRHTSRPLPDVTGVHMPPVPVSAGAGCPCRRRPGPPCPARLEGTVTLPRRVQRGRRIWSEGRQKPWLELSQPGSEIYLPPLPGLDFDAVYTGSAGLAPPENSRAPGRPSECQAIISITDMSTRAVLGWAALVYASSDLPILLAPYGSRNGGACVG